jgi:L-amino acid N-acyltransferase YncA
MISGVDAPTLAPKLRFLLDTNVFIALEPYAGGMETGIEPAAELMRLTGKQGHRLFVHPATRDDLLEGRDATRRRQALAELGKFEMLAESPISADLRTTAGDSTEGSNDHRDLRLLAALASRAVTYLVTEDVRLRRRARRCGLGDSILSIDEAADLLLGLEPRVNEPPPTVERLKAYALDTDQAIFESFRRDYGGFDLWLQRIRADSDNRECYIVRDADEVYAALAFVKRLEPDCVYDLPQPVAKLASFKVASGHGGRRYGELLLKAVFNAASSWHCASLYVAVLPKYSVLVDFLGDFGFVDIGHPSELGEIVLAKMFRPPAGAAVEDSFTYHVLHGPPAVSSHASIFLVPIQGRWHAQLFPDSPATPALTEQLHLPGLTAPTTLPWGNALRKAYLCHSPSNQLGAGDALLFYQSGEGRSVTAIGVVERTLRSSDPNEILSVVGGRTVYNPDEVARMCRSVRDVLVILFRQDRFIDPAWGLTELQLAGVANGWPQSIMQVRGEGALWVHRHLAQP